MSLEHGAKIVTDGLVFAYDAGNQKVHRKNSNLVADRPWSVGTGSEAWWGQNGDGNSRIITDNPFGQQDIVWDTSNNDIDSNADGGFNGSLLDIDPTKMHRFSVWVRRNVLGNGHFYLGVNAYDATTNIGVLYRTNNTINTTNPYFEVNVHWAEWGNIGEWYLVVAHVWPAGTATGTAHVDTGVYDTSGNKIYNGSIDFIWNTGTTRAYHRSYLFYSTEPTTNQQWYAPRIDVCDGGEPSVQQLIRNVHNEQDLVGHNNINNYGAIKDVQNSTFIFGDGVYIDAGTPAALDFGTGNFTLSFVQHRTGTGFQSGSYVSKGNGTSEGFDFRDGTFYVHATGQGLIASMPFSSTLNTLEYHTFVFDRTSSPYITHYVNGEYNGVSTVNNATYAGLSIDTTFPLRVGLSTAGGIDRYFIGDMSLVMLHNIALSTSEVKQNFNAIKGRFGL